MTILTHTNQPAGVAGTNAEQSAAGSPSRRTALVRSGAVTVAGQLATFGVSLGATMVLARLLDPADFGLYAMAYTLVVFVGSFRDFGLPMAALQSRHLDDLQSSALFWLNLRITAVIVLGMIAMGPVLAWFYGEPRLTALSTVMCGGVLAAALANQHQARLTRQLRFGTLAGWDLGFFLAASLAAVALAVAGAGPWALVAQFVLWQVGRAAAIWIASGWIPNAPKGLADARRHVAPLVSFGAYLTGYRVLSRAGRDLDRVLIGYLAGTTALGLYDAAVKWARLPIQQIYSPLLGVTVAGLSHVRDDDAAFRRNARAILTPVLGVTVPALAFGAVSGGPLILVLLGPKWTAAIPLFRWLCVGGIAFAALKTMKWLYVATGNTQRQFRWGLASSPLYAVAIALGAMHSPYGVAVAFAAANWLLLVPGLAYCLRGIPLGLGQYLAMYARPAVAAAVGSTAAWGVGWLVAADEALVEFLVMAPAFGVVYASAWLLLPGGFEAARLMSDLARSFRSVDAREAQPARRTVEGNTPAGVAMAEPGLSG